jgi:MFS family permease
VLTEDAGGVWAPERRRLTAGLVLTITLVAFEALAVATVMPTVEDELGGLALYGWVFSGFFLANLAGVVLTGIVSDRRGPVVPFAAGLALFSLGLVGAGLAGSMPVLVAARVAQGLGAGAIPASAYASVARGYPAGLRPRVFAITSTAWVIPGVVGPSLASLIEHASSWRWVFLGLLPLVGVAAAMTIPSLARLGRAAGDDHLRTLSAADRRRIGLMLVLVAGVGLVLGAGSAPSGVAGAALVAAGLPLAAVGFVRLVPLGTVRLAPGLPATVAVRGVLTWAFFGVDAFVSLAVIEADGGSTFLVGAVLSVTAVAWSAASWVQERVIGTVGPRRLDRTAFVLLTVGGLGMVAVARGLPAWTALVAWGVAGFGMGLGYSALSVTALGSAAPGREGEASASLQLCDVLGISIGTGLGGAVVALGDGRGWDVTSSLAVVCGLGVVVALVGLVAAGRLPDAVPGS